MKKIFSSLVVLSALTLAANASVKGKVNVTDFLNVRQGPGLRYAVTGRLNPDQEVEIFRIADNWLEIKAPETLKIYVSEARIDAEGKLTGELNMRSRMDSTAPSYGVLGKGSVVKRLPERRNGWVRIVPPENLKVYVAAICVNFDRSKFDEKGLPQGSVKAEETKAEEKKVEENKTEIAAPAPLPAEKAEETKEVKVAAPAAPAPAPEVKAEEVKAEEVKAAKSFTGVIVKWKFAKTPDTALALLDAPNGKNQAFVTGKTPDIRKELTEIADSGTAVEVAGNYIAGKIPPVFEVSAVTKKYIQKNRI